MLKRLLLIIVVLACVAPLHAQSGFTSVVGTALDPNNNAYQNCRVSAAFVPAPGSQQQSLLNGSVFPTTVSAVQCDSFGAFTLTLADNNIVTPAGSKWTISVVSADQCFPNNKFSFTLTLTVTGALQNVTAALKAVAAPLPACATSGPAGPAGPTGPIGPPGPAGATGPPGVGSFGLTQTGTNFIIANSPLTSSGSINIQLVPTITANTSGNAATATALAATPSNCGAGVAATGVAANGNAVGCFAPASGGAVPWSSLTTYSLGFAVTYNGFLYISKSNGNLNNLPTNTTFWNLIGSGPGIPFLGPDPVYDVTNVAYGAVGDGATDDTTAIQAAINAQVASGAGGHIYFPCGKTFKFGTLNLSGASGTNWTILEFCGTPKPTATITLSVSYEGIIGHPGQSLTRPAGSRMPTVGFDLSAFVGTGPVIAVAQGLINGFYISGIEIAGAPGDAIKFGTGVTGGPTLATIENSNLGVANSSTGACIDTNLGFGLYLFHVQCTGSNTNANTGIVSHGTGIIWADDIMLERRGFLFDGPGVTGLIGTIHVGNVYTENFLDTALFTIHTNAYGGDGFDFGPGVIMADNQPGGGLYVVQHTGDTNNVKYQFHGLNSFTGYTTAFANGTNLISVLDGQSGISMTNGAALNAAGATNSFGPGGGGTNNSLVVNQFQVQNPALVEKSIASGEQGDQLFITSNDHGQLGSFFSNLAFGSLYGWTTYDITSGFKGTFAGGSNILTADRTYTLPNLSGTLALTTGPHNNGNCASWDATGRVVDNGAACGGGGGGGSVTSVGLAAPTGFTVTGSPVVASGTLTFAMPTGWVTGDLLLGNGSNSVTRLGIGANGTFLTSNGTTASWGTAGTVTSVNTTFTGGLISGSGCSYTTTGTCSLTVAGTSGGVPYFTSPTTWASSAVLGNNQVMLGGGAGQAPKVAAADATTTHALFATAGAPAFRAIAGGDLPAINLAAGGGGGVTGLLPVANMTFNANILPSAINTVNIGSNALPFINYFFGTVANQAGSFAQAFTANRVFTWPDKSGTVAMLSDIAAPPAFAAGLVNDYPCWNGSALADCTPGVPTDTQSASTYTVSGTADRGAWLKRTNTTAGADTLPQAGSATFTNSFFTTYLCQGTATCTLTPTTSTFTYNGTSGLTSLALNAGDSAFVEADNNTNYNAIIIRKQDTTATNCAGVGTAASPSVASCGSATAGHFSCATNASGATCTVNTTAVTANSEIFVFESDTTVTGTALGVTCNTSTNVLPTSRLLAASVAATSFTINLGTVTTNPACFSYHIIN